MKESKKFEVMIYQNGSDLCNSCGKPFKEGEKFIKIERDIGNEDNVLYKAGKLNEI